MEQQSSVRKLKLKLLIEPDEPLSYYNFNFNIRLSVKFNKTVKTFRFKKYSWYIIFLFENPLCYHQYFISHKLLSHKINEKHFLEGLKMLWKKIWMDSTRKGYRGELYEIPLRELYWGARKDCALRWLVAVSSVLGGPGVLEI